MKRVGPGLGSTLALLTFSTLCLSLFAILALSSALTDKALADAAVQTVKGYYEADILAECILAEIIESETVPDVVRGVPITVGGENDAVAFCCYISDTKELYVKALIVKDGYSILNWQMRNTNQWEADTHLPVWSGDDVSE